MERMILSTWNVMLPVSERRRSAIRAHIDEIAPDVIVLTEAHDGFDAGLPHTQSSAPGRDGGEPPEHRWVTIASRHRLEPIATSDVERTAAAWVEPSGGERFIVYGTVLPWLGSAWRGHPSAAGAAYAAALDVQRADWIALRRDHPDAELFVIGDFNQDLVEPRYYGSRVNRVRLEAALSAAGLVVLTGDGDDPVRRDSPSHASIDHIALRSGSRGSARRTFRWPDLPVPSRSLSDHFGIGIEL